MQQSDCPQLMAEVVESAAAVRGPRAASMQQVKLRMLGMWRLMELQDAVQHETNEMGTN